MVNRPDSFDDLDEMLTRAREAELAGPRPVLAWMKEDIAKDEAGLTSTVN